MKESIVIDPRTEDAANSPLEIYREPGHGPGLYVQRDSERYPDPPQEKARVAGRDGDRASGRPRYGNREIGLGILAINDPSIGAGTNLHPEPVPGSSATGWASGTGTVEIDTTRAYLGDRSWKLTRTSAGSGDLSFYPTDAAKHFPVAPLKRYVCTYRVQAKDAAAVLRQARAEVSFYVDSGGSPGAQVGSTTQGALTAEQRAEWIEVSVATIAPLTAAWARSQVRFDSIPQGEVHFVSAGMVEERLPSLKEAMQSLGSTLLLGALPNPAANALQDISGNAYAGSLQNGALIDSTVMVPGEAGALSLAGSAYGSFAAPTRRNYVQDPRATDAAHWSCYRAVGSPETFVPVSDPGNGPLGHNNYGRVTADGVSACYGVVGGGASAGGMAEKSPVDPNTDYRLSAYCRTTDTDPTDAIGLVVAWYNSTTGFISSAEYTIDSTVPSATWKRHKSTNALTSPSNATHATVYGVQNGTPPNGTVFEAGAFKLETGASVTDYHDGLGYVNASGTWVASDGLECGWLGTAHASASDKGPLGNGKTLTFVGVAQVSADAASGVGQALWGSNLDTNGTRVRLLNDSGTRKIRLGLGGSSYDWTLTADEIAATAAGQTFAYRLEFNESADTATLQIAKIANGVATSLPAVTKTGVTAQHGPGQTAVQLGAYSSGSSPFPGKLGPADILAGTISPAAWTAYLAILASGGGSSVPTPVFTGDTPGCAWDTVNARTCSQRPAPDIRLDRIVGDWEAKIAKIADRGGTYRRRFESGTIIFDLEGAEQTEEGEGRTYRQGLYKASASLEAAAFARGPSETRTLRNETASPVLSFEELAIPGPVAALGELLVSETSANDRRGVVAAVQVNGYDPAQSDTQNYLRAIDLTPLGGAASVADAASNSGNVVEARLSTDWTVVLSTQKSGGAHLKHAGPHKVWARIKAPAANTGTLSVRLLSAQGDLLNEVAGPIRVVPLAGDYWLADLGIVRIDQKSAAEQQWRGVIAAKSSVGGDKIDIDDLRVLPVGDAYVETSAPIRDLSAWGTYEVDSFDQSAGALNGELAPSGQPWATAGGDPDDFFVNATAHQLNRSAVGDASMIGGRFATIGGVKTSMFVGVELGLGLASVGYHGVLARFVNVTNFLAVGIYADGFGAGFLLLTRVVGGVKSDMFAGPSVGLNPSGMSVGVSVLPNGAWQVFKGGEPQEEGQHATLAGAGALASGKAGIYDAHLGGAASTRAFDNFRASVPPLDAALYASKKWRWRWDGAERENSADTAFSSLRPDGDPLYVPPSGREGRRARVVVMPSDGDLGGLSDGARRNFSAQISLTPRYLSVRGR